MPNSRSHKGERSYGATLKSMNKMTTNIIQALPGVKAITDAAAKPYGAKMRHDDAVSNPHQKKVSRKPGPAYSKAVPKKRKLP